MPRDLKICRIIKINSSAVNLLMDSALKELKIKIEDILYHPNCFRVIKISPSESSIFFLGNKFYNITNLDILSVKLSNVKQKNDEKNKEK